MRAEASNFLSQHFVDGFPLPSPTQHGNPYSAFLCKASSLDSVLLGGSALILGEGRLKLWRPRLPPRVVKTWSQQVQNKNRVRESLPSGAAAEPTATFVFEVGSYPQNF